MGKGKRKGRGSAGLSSLSYKDPINKPKIRKGVRL